MPNPLSILPSRLGEFHPEERARPGRELRTMRLLGRRRHPLSESRSRDDATLACSGASITQPLRLVSAGPFHKAFSTAICQGDIHFSQTSLQFRSTRYGIDFDLYQKFCKWQKYLAIFAYTDNFDFPYVSFRINLDTPSERPFIQKALVK